MTTATDQSKLEGTLSWVLTDKDGRIKSKGETHNLVTQVGDQVYGERGAGIGAAPAAPVGAKLGTGGTAVAKTGAGAALVTYLAGSNLVHDSTYPQSSVNVNSRRITYRFTWAAGVATTATPITEVVITNNANADATSAAANTVSRALVAVGAKGASDSLVITWNHDLLGA